MKNKVAWIHADNLNPHQPALTQQAGIPAIFVWDDELLHEWDISFKRIVFIYECLLELPVTIRRGNVAEEVVQFAQQHNATDILTAASPSPRHRLICQSIISQMPASAELHILHDAPFVDYDNERLDLKRFSRYWGKAQGRALRPTDA